MITNCRDNLKMYPRAEPFIDEKYYLNKNVHYSMPLERERAWECELSSG